MKRFPEIEGREKEVFVRIHNLFLLPFSLGRGYLELAFSHNTVVSQASGLMINFSNAFGKYPIQALLHLAILFRTAGERCVSSLCLSLMCTATEVPLFLTCTWA